MLTTNEGLEEENRKEDKVWQQNEEVMNLEIHEFEWNSDEKNRLEENKLLLKVGSVLIFYSIITEDDLWTLKEFVLNEDEE